MSEAAHIPDPMEAIKKMFGGMGFALPGMVTPTLNLDDLDKNIADLKSVEGWLKANLSILQMNIQTMELQRASVAAFKAMGESFGKSAEAAEAPPTQPAAEGTGIPLGTAELAKAANVAEAALGAMLNPANWTLGAKPAEPAPEPAKKPRTRAKKTPKA